MQELQYAGHVRSNLKDLDQLDWHSIRTNDFRNNNGDEDRVRKKHSEFLVKEYVPASQITAIVVMTSAVQSKVQTILDELNLNISIHVNPNKQFYFL